MSGCSIIVCCYNSATRIPATLTALFNLNLSGCKVEIILVDNNSTDGTKDIALQIFDAEYKINNNIEFRVIFEEKAGLSFARLKGVQSALHELIVFCDDDNILHQDYVINAIRHMPDPSIGITGGYGIPKATENIPYWFEENKLYYATGPQAPEKSSQVYGAGMVTRKSLFLAIYNSGFSLICEDRKGASLSSGGDTEYCYWVKMLGYRIVYEPSLQFFHVIPSSRLTLNYLEELKSGIGVSFARLLVYRYKFSQIKVTSWLLFKDLIYVSAKALASLVDERISRQFVLYLTREHFDLLVFGKKKFKQIDLQLSAIKSALIK